MPRGLLCSVVVAALSAASAGGCRTESPAPWSHSQQRVSAVDDGNRLAAVTVRSDAREASFPEESNRRLSKQQQQQQQQQRRQQKQRTFSTPEIGAAGLAARVNGGFPPPRRPNEETYLVSSRLKRIFQFCQRGGLRNNVRGGGETGVLGRAASAFDAEGSSGVVARLRAGAERPDDLSHADASETKGGGAVLGGRDKGDLAVRTKSALILVSSFLVIIVKLKQTGCAILVAFLQWALFREGMAIARDEVNEVLLEAEKGGAKSLRRRQWGVFWVLGLTVYGRLLVKEIAGIAAPSPWMASFCRWHIPACAALYVGLLLEFITSLRSPPLIIYQLGQLAAAHFACFLILPSALVSFAARAGLIWFVIPSASVIINDIMAYICGRLFGRTQLTVLSPKKTREGFVGAAICTSATGWLLGRWLGGVGWLNSPRNVLLLNGEDPMDVGAIFSQTVKLPWSDLMASHAEIHAFWIAMLASLIGPFGGFLASGIKRAYGVKDFGDTIPGHGGAGDRFDCQVMLLPLVYFYLRAFAPELAI